MSNLYPTQVSYSTPFDNSTNGFTATNAQEAIEESLTVAVGKPRYSIVTTFNSTIANNDWLGYSNLMPGDQVPILIPVNSVLKEITFAYNATSVDGVFSLYKNGLVSPTNVVLTNTFTDQDYRKLISGLSITFSAGDYMVGRWTDTGTNPSDAAITYFLQVL